MARFNEIKQNQDRFEAKKKLTRKIKLEKVFLIIQFLMIVYLVVKTVYP